MTLVEIHLALVGLEYYFGAAIDGLWALLGRERRTRLSLPAPTGHYAIGRTNSVWVTNRSMTSSLQSRGLNGSDRLDLVPGGHRKCVNVCQGQLLACNGPQPRPAHQPFTPDSRMVRVHSTVEPDVSAGQPSDAVVLMRAGGGP